MIPPEPPEDQPLAGWVQLAGGLMIVLGLAAVLVSILALCDWVTP